MSSKMMLSIISIVTFTVLMFYEKLQHPPNEYVESEMYQNEEVVSLVYIIAGSEWTRYQFLTHFKSLLSHTSATLDLHMFVDQTSNLSMNTLFSTWKLANVNYTFYDMEEQIKNISWIPNKHYSKHYGLMKILIPTAVNRDKIIFLDVDTIMRCDIRELSNLFHKMTSKQSIAMTENFSTYYLKRKKTVWPAMGRGFNSGVILIDIKKLLAESLNWNKLWQTIVMTNLKYHNYVTLADQDIYNAIIAENPSWIYKLPCEYNYQFKKMNICHHDLKIHHFNQPEKVFNPYLKSVASQDVSYLKMNRENVTDFPVKKECDVYTPAHDFVTIPFVLGYDGKETELGLCVQLSADRLAHFLKMQEFWKHPVSVAVYGSDDELKKVYESLLKLKRSDMFVHFVFKNEESIFPINFLRNVAIQYGNFKKLILVDTDFVILGDYEKMLRDVSELKSDEILVLPSVEFSSWNYLMEYNTKTLPMNKNEVIKMLDEKILKPFRVDVWPKGHNATNIEKWKTSEKVYEIDWQPGYEPYIIIEKSIAPKYDERFGGFGWNKMAHILQIYHQKLKFKVSSSNYLIHQNHQPSEGLEMYRSDSQYKQCLKKLKATVLLEIKNEFV